MFTTAIFRPAIYDVQFDEDDDMFQDAIEHTVRVVLPKVNEVFEEARNTERQQDISKVIDYVTDDHQNEMIPFANQHTALSEINDKYMDGDHILSINFPAVSPELLTKSYGDNMWVLREDRWEVGVSNAHNLVAAQEIDERDTDAVAVTIATVKGAFKYFIWDDAGVKPTFVPCPLYLRKADTIYKNYTNRFMNEEITPVYFQYISLSPDKSYILTLDGLPYRLSDKRYVQLQAVDGSWKDKNGVIYGITTLKGVFWIDIDSMVPVKQVYSPAYSTQQVTNVRLNAWITKEFLQKYPQYIGEFKAITDLRVQVVDKFNTGFLGVQLLRRSKKQKIKDMIALMRSNECDYQYVLSDLYLRGHYVGNVRIFGYTGAENKEYVLRVRNRWYVQVRMKGAERLVVKKNKYAIPVGTWYELVV